VALEDGEVVCLVCFVFSRGLRSACRSFDAGHPPLSVEFDGNDQFYQIPNIGDTIAESK